MRGKVLGVDHATGSGVISGEDGQRYPVILGSLGAGVSALRPGQDVDFEIDDQRRAKDVFPFTSSPTSEKSKIAAGLLALFLGGLGIHKFYLGYSGAGALMLLVTLVGFIFLGIPSLIVGIIAFVEAIIYLTRNDDAFHATYVVNRKTWF